MKHQVNAAHFFTDLQRQEDRQLRQQALNDPERFVELARRQGYQLSREQLTDDLSNLSPEVVAAIWNPGIGARRHLIRR